MALILTIAEFLHVVSDALEYISIKVGRCLLDL